MRSADLRIAALLAAGASMLVAATGHSPSVHFPVAALIVSVRVCLDIWLRAGRSGRARWRRTLSRVVSEGASAIESVAEDPATAGRRRVPIAELLTANSRADV
jgi:hypothetical protein